MKSTQTIGPRDRRHVPQEDAADPESLVSVSTTNATSSLSGRTSGCSTM